MKVAFVTAFPKDPTTPHGGVESVSVNLVHALARLGGLDLHVLTTDADRHAPETSRWDRVTVHRLPRRGRHVLTDALGPGRRLVRDYILALQPEVIHAHDVFGLMVKGLPIPRVFTIHGFIHADTQVSGTRFAWLRAQLWHWVETSGWADQPHIISISPYVRERLNGNTRSVIHDIDNPIAADFFELPRHAAPGRILCAALLCPRKNQLGLLEAFARLAARQPDACLRLAGATSAPEYEARLRTRIAALNLTSRVTLLGPLSSTQVRQELAAASLFALVSLEEGAPLGIEEAMAAGVPVVTSNRCGMPYMVRDGESGFLVDPRDPADVAARLEDILADAALRTRMGETARRIALDRFHPDVVARRTLQVYERAARDHEHGNGYAHT